MTSSDVASGVGCRPSASPRPAVVTLMPVRHLPTVFLKVVKSEPATGDDSWSFSGCVEAGPTEVEAAEGEGEGRACFSTSSSPGSDLRAANGRLLALLGMAASNSIFRGVAGPLGKRTQRIRVARPFAGEASFAADAFGLPSCLSKRLADASRLALRLRLLRANLSAERTIDAEGTAGTSQREGPSW
mmetsp:Transcript_82544/g.224182  ORF Transcript_82544/g.224182 Transcript_82544/m.224182 type:complete len:187 (+) Transcript_82544:801-1361(+)